MSKSTKQPILNDFGYLHKKAVYRRRLRRSIKNFLKKCENEMNYDDMVNPPHGKTIVNQYDWCDWRYDHRKEVCYSRRNGGCHLWNKELGPDITREQVCEECRKRYSRK